MTRAMTAEEFFNFRQQMKGPTMCAHCQEIIEVGDMDAWCMIDPTDHEKILYHHSKCLDLINGRAKTH